MEQAETILTRIRQEGILFAAKHSADHLAVRQELKNQVRGLFIKKGGRPVRERPHYMKLVPCPWLLDWYSNDRELSIPLATFDPLAISLTYGDTFPAMRYGDGKPYRKQVYTISELPDLIRQHGLPQEWNPDGKLGSDRYIEAQVWQDIPLC